MASAAPGPGPTPDDRRGAWRRRLASLGLVALATAACSDERLWHEVELTEAIAEAAREAGRRGPPVALVLDAAAPFVWDRVYVFPPYTPRATLEASLGPDAAARLADTGIEWHEDVALLVLVRADGEVVEHLALPRCRADFAGVPTEGGIDREAAIFRVEPDRRHPGWLRVLPPAARPATG